MPLRVDESPSVVPRDDLRVREAARARAADVRERGCRDEENLAARREPAREVDVLEPKLEVLVPTAHGLEDAAAHEQARARRLVDRDDDSLVELQRRSRPSEQGGGKCDWARKRPGQVLLLRPAVSRADEPSRSCHGVRSLLERIRQLRDRLVAGEHVVVEEENQLGASCLGAPVVCGGQTFRLVQADDLHARSPLPQSVCGPVERAVVDDDDAREQRGAKVLNALEHELAGVPGCDDYVNHRGLIPSPTVRGQASGSLDANLRSGPQMLMYRSLAHDLARRSPGRLLDWGCGWGQMTALLREAAVETVAFDYRADLEAPTTERLPRFPEIEVHVSSEPVRLPFDAESFDSVLSCGVLEHVPDPDGSLAELGRLLKPGGMFYVANLPNKYSYTERLARMLGRYYHGRLPDDRVYTSQTARELLERHSFTVVESRRKHMLPLTVGGPARATWAVSSALERIPGLNLLATSLELVAYSEA
jgi:ubiquinone/menaquinone biosynthesis C-methylase UbiE